MTGWIYLISQWLEGSRGFKSTACFSLCPRCHLEGSARPGPGQGLAGRCSLQQGPVPHPEPWQPLPRLPSSKSLVSQSPSWASGENRGFLSDTSARARTTMEERGQEGRCQPVQPAATSVLCGLHLAGSLKSSNQEEKGKMETKVQRQQ